MDRIRVVLADDHPVVLAGIRALLNADPEVELVGEATDGGEALPMIRAVASDVAVVDVSMPGLNGLELTERVTGECPGTWVLVLTVHEDAAYVQPLMRARRARLPPQALGRGRPAPCGPGRGLRRRLSRPVHRWPRPGGNLRLGRAPGHGEGREPLSPREAETLRLIAQGFSNKEIARRIDISVKSVETYKARAAEKLGLRTRAEIIRYGAAHGWFDALALR